VVTHQGMAPIATPPAPTIAKLTQCVICGHSSPWFNPFHRVVRRRRHRHGPAKVQKNTFSDDR
jgi:hypothetical protein